MSVSPPEENRSGASVDAELKRLRERVAFYEAFDVQDSDGMWLPEEERVAIW